MAEKGDNLSTSNGGPAPSSAAMHSNEEANLNNRTPAGPDPHEPNTKSVDMELEAPPQATIKSGSNQPETVANPGNPWPLSSGYVAGFMQNPHRDTSRVNPRRHQRNWVMGVPPPLTPQTAPVNQTFYEDSIQFATNWGHHSILFGQHEYMMRTPANTAIRPPTQPFELHPLNNEERAGANNQVDLATTVAMLGQQIATLQSQLAAALQTQESQQPSATNAAVSHGRSGSTQVNAPQTHTLPPNPPRGQQLHPQASNVQPQQMPPQQPLPQAQTHVISALTSGGHHTARNSAPAADSRSDWMGKFQLVVATLESDLLDQIHAAVTAPPAGSEFSNLKKAIERYYADSEQQKMRKLMAGYKLGDQKPSQLLNIMYKECDLACLKNSPLVRQVWFNALPVNLQAAMAATIATAPAEADLLIIAETADKIWEQSGATTI